MYFEHPNEHHCTTVNALEEQGNHRCCHNNRRESLDAAAADGESDSGDKRPLIG